MSEPFVAEIRIFGFNFAPVGWAFCNGQLMSINQNQALFAILGTTYGGDGTTTFALPNLQGRIPIHRAGSYPQGSMSGEEAHTLDTTEIPSHTHGVQGSSDAPNQSSPVNGFWPTVGALTPYAPGGDGSTMASGVVGLVGDSRMRIGRRFW